MADDASLEYTIIGLRKNGMPVKVEGLDTIATLSGHLTREKVLEYAESGNDTERIAAVVIWLAFGVTGTVILIKFSGGTSLLHRKRASIVFNRK